MKTRTPSAITRVLSLFLTAALLIPALIPPSFAWSGAPEVNAVNLYVGDTAMLSTNENIVLENEDGTTESPGSLRCDSMVYLPFEILLEMGAEFRVEEDPETGNVPIEIDYIDYINCGPSFSRKRAASSASLKGEFQTNLFDIFADGAQIAQKGKDVTYNGKEYPSSIWTADTLYLPLNIILQSLDIAFSWPERASIVITGSSTRNGRIGLVNFERNPANYSGQFTDVPSSAWYADHVRAAVEYGVMIGTSSTTFGPGRSISVAEAVTVAARLHNTYYDRNYEFQSGSPWYQAYVDYALEKRIIPAPFPDYERPITRAEFAVIMANTFSLPMINDIEIGGIPDVPEGSSYYDAVYSLYCAGVLSGTDEYGTFNPDAEITRAEVSTILGNMVDESLRKTFTLEAPVYPDSVELPGAMTVPVGAFQQLTAIIGPPEVNRGMGLTWTSSNPDVASVSKGKVSAKKAGTTKITVTTANGLSASCMITAKSQADLDMQFAKKAFTELKYGLKFPDTLEVYNMWAFDFTSRSQNLLAIYIYYSAENSLGLRSRGEFRATYNVGTGELSYSSFEDSLFPHSVDRPLDIHKVMGA